VLPRLAPRTAMRGRGGESQMAKAYASVLFVQPGELGEPEGPSSAVSPEVFDDLQLDKVVAGATAGREVYDLTPYFYTPLPTSDAIVYRQEVFRDLECAAVLAGVNAFAQAMRSVHASLEQAAKMYYRRQRERWFLDAVRAYCRAVEALAAALSDAKPRSRGLRGIREGIETYLTSDAFVALRDEAEAIEAGLADVQYCVLIRDATVTVRPYEGEDDYSAQVERTFAKFRTANAKSYAVSMRDWAEMNHVEANILDLVARLYPEVFDRLSAFHATHTDFIDSTVARFEREVQFYLAYLDLIAPVRRAGLSFCYPEMRDSWADTFVRAGFDLALAVQLAGEGQGPPIANDWEVAAGEPIVFVTGPNNGGKTTFARALGQAHVLAKLGCPVPGEEARLCLVDAVFTHFERREDALSAMGKLENDLLRMRDILDRASPRSVIIANEMLASTTLRDAAALGRRLLARIRALGALCVWVTFIDELAAENGQVVSLVAVVDDEDPTVRTYKIERHAPLGRAYAVSVARRYDLTYESVRRRVGA
jgi:DNA mismatch repair protein MutS